MEALQILSRNEMKKITAGRLETSTCRMNESCPSGCEHDGLGSPPGEYACVKTKCCVASGIELS